ncbi:MAG: hypothetical protein PHX83_03095 [Acidobacteriia bacterium]|nr:hypothetical protein [Terriglobia bacterium]
MIRKQIYIAPDQDERLKKIARTLRTTEASIIRQSLERLFTVGPLPTQDLKHWKQELLFIRRRKRRNTASPKTTWNRADLHDRRSIH